MNAHLNAGRAQMGTSLSFHLFFGVLGVGLPLMMLAAEGMHLRTGDPTWRALARRWSKVFASPWLLGYATNHSAWLSDLVTGVLISILAGRAVGISTGRLVPRRHRGARSRAALEAVQSAGSGS